MLAHPEGRRLLETRQRVTEQSVQLSTLRNLPPSTFGAAYAAYMDSHG